MDYHLLEFLSSHSYWNFLLLDKMKGTNVDKINRYRSAYGEFYHLYPDLQVQADDKKIKEYMHTSQEMFQYSEKRLDQHLVH